ncbi:unnamed protein product [Symbiodinium necroappetens]|uniref:Uncharacterized protein n=1 Tax=Symbiodinium necroappetens TaxID=1628268 RepID=A0A812JD58_9DINO|nr:unnamed protein product [Symbiodinium necroappetens]
MGTSTARQQSSLLKLHDADHVIDFGELDDVLERLEGRFHQERAQRLDMEVQLQAISRANFALQCNLNWMTLHSHQLQWKLYCANEQLEDCTKHCHQLASWFIPAEQHHWQDMSAELPDPERGSTSWGGTDSNRSWSCGSTHSNESSTCAGTDSKCGRAGSNESSSCIITSNESATSDCDDGTDSGGSTCVPPEQRVLFDEDEDTQDGDWVLIPRMPMTKSTGMVKTGQLGAQIVSLNRTTSEDRFVQSGASRAMESTQSVERTQLISDDEFESRRSQGSSQEDSRMDAACQTDFEDGTVGWSLPETSATICSDGPMVGGGEFAPYDLLLPSMLPYLSVKDLLNWRRLSQQTRSPEALIQHVAGLGSMERPESVVNFADMTFSQKHRAASFGNDAAQKLHDCRNWCLSLAFKGKTHFAESHVKCIVGENLQWLLRHNQSSDAAVVGAAGQVLFNCAAKGLPFVQQMIAAAMLERADCLIQSGIRANIERIWDCFETLLFTLRSLSMRERQTCASLLVKLLLEYGSPKGKTVLEKLNLLWIVDDDPKRTYADVVQQLRIFAKSPASEGLTAELEDLVLFA